MKRWVVVLLVVGGAFLGCAYAEQDDETVTTSAMRGGCHTECPPPCRPGEPCILAPCVLVCNGPGERCGNHFCPQGQVCCNESCGICTEPFGFCTMQYCAYAGPKCRSDSDCRLFSDYCTGCDCRALRFSEPGPTCDGPGVRCLIDPCMGKAAVCDLPSGKCVVR
jgi:hypothetical protein